LNRYKPHGWRNESQRHSLAARGIKTNMAYKQKFSFAADEEESMEKRDDTKDVKFEEAHGEWKPWYPMVFGQGKGGTTRPLGWGDREWRIWFEKKHPEEYKNWYETKYLPWKVKQSGSAKKRWEEEHKLRETLGKDIFEELREEEKRPTLEEVFAKEYPNSPHYAQIQVISPAHAARMQSDIDKEKHVAEFEKLQKKMAEKLKGTKIKRVEIEQELAREKRQKEGMGEGDLEDDEQFLFGPGGESYAAKRRSFAHTSEQIDKMMDIEKQIGDEIGKPNMDTEKIKMLRRQKDDISRGVA
jgi:hypothetical protein